MTLEYKYNLNYNITSVYVYSSSIGEVTQAPEQPTPTETPSGTSDTDNNNNQEEQLDFSDTSRFVELGQSMPQSIQSEETTDNPEQQEKVQKYAVEYIIDDNSDIDGGTPDSILCLVDENIKSEGELKNKVIEFTVTKEKIQGYIRKEDKSVIPYLNTDIGSQWFLSESLYNKYFKDILPENNYINESDIVRDTSDMSDDLLYNKDIKHWWKINNINYIKNRNKFSDDELDSFSQTFFNVLNKYSNYIYETGSSRTVSVYNKLIKYYINNKVDNTMSDIDLILNTNINTVTTNSTGSSFCGCNSGGSSSVDNISTDQSCYNIYQSALATWTKEMFSDIINFYNNWFFDKYTDDTGKECLKPNTSLCDIFIALIDEYINTNPDIQSILNSSDTTTNSFISDKLYCGCNKTEIKSPCDYNILNNFKKVLEYIKNNEVVSNINKIQYWGGQFGELVNKL